MRIFSFISSIIAFLATLFFLITEFPDTRTLNGVIYFMLLLVLLIICITGIIINIPTSSRVHRRFRIADHAKH